MTALMRRMTAKAATMIAVAVLMLSLPPAAARADAPGAAAPPAVQSPVQAVPAPVRDWLIERFAKSPEAPQRSESRQAGDDGATHADIRPLLRFMQFYYMRPALKSLGPFLREVDRTNLLGRHPDAFAIVSGFVSRLAALNPEQIPGWLSGGDFRPKTKAMLQYAIWRAGHLNDPAVAKFFTEKPVYLSTTPGTLAASALRTPEDLDLMWGGFLATGDDFYVNRLIDALDPAKSAPDMDETARDLLIATAAATLKANALNHDIVLRTLQKRLEAAEAGGTLQQRLAALLPRETPGAQFAAHDGNFGAMLVVSPLDDIMGQISKQGDERLAFPATVTVQRGRKIGFLIVYSGMALSDDLSANLDFDMSLTAPDGTAEQGGSLLHKQAFAGKLPSRFDILHTPSFMGVEFTPQDADGLYRLDATLHDNIAHRSLPLHAFIRLAASGSATAQGAASPAAQTGDAPPAKTAITNAEKSATPEAARPAYGGFNQ
ncbi:MAG: hypothetical protein GC185_09435 [Alphaproteobacteria bacterium]|nr:hypothetical protein [Alphaproteobacteria bacterium]